VATVAAVEANDRDPLSIVIDAVDHGVIVVVRFDICSYSPVDADDKMGA
jgi:hypothetical protein